MTLLLGLYLGIGVGMLVCEGLDYGPPTSVVEVLNWALAPILWPLAAWRRRR